MTKDIYQCNHCEKFFNNQTSLNIHIGYVNSLKTQKEKCLTCERKISKTHFKKHLSIRKTCPECNELFCPNGSSKIFCSRSCSASYNNKGRKYKNKRIEVEKWYCKNCGKEHRKSNKGKNNYCDNSCQFEFQWIEKTKEIEKGKIRKATTLKKYIIEKHGDKCSKCDILNEWNGEPLVLQLDHIDGNSDNNLPTNLRLLCPNCHSQTDTFTCKGGITYKNTKRNRYLREKWKN